MMVHCVPMSGLIDSRKLYSTLRVSLLEKEGGEVAEALYDYPAVRPGEVPGVHRKRMGNPKSC